MGKKAGGCLELELMRGSFNVDAMYSLCVDAAGWRFLKLKVRRDGGREMDWLTVCEKSTRLGHVHGPLVTGEGARKMTATMSNVLELRIVLVIRRQPGPSSLMSTLISSRSTGSASASRREMGGSFGSNSSRPSAFSVASAANNSPSRQGSTGSDGFGRRHGGGPISPHHFCEANQAAAPRRHEVYPTIDVSYDQHREKATIVPGFST